MLFFAIAGPAGGGVRRREDRWDSGATCWACPCSICSSAASASSRRSAAHGGGASCSRASSGIWSTGRQNGWAAGTSDSPRGLASCRPGIDEAHESVVAFKSLRGLAGAVLGHRPLGPFPRQQAAGGIRGAASARHARKLRRHAAGADAGHVSALLRAHARRVRGGRGALGRGDVDPTCPGSSPPCTL